MFHVLVVENPDERHLATAAWAFPLYLFAMSLFVVPIAVVGLALMPEGANPDLFVLTVPLELGQDGLAMLAFLGGFSSATSMVIVAAIALATMVSNNIVLPLWLSSRQGGAIVSGDVREVVLASRRLSIGAVLALGYLYFRLSGGGTALAAIGLISFTGVVQVIPALLGGIFWRGATRAGAAAGLLTGFAVWLYCLFLPSFGDGVLSAALLAEGPFGQSAGCGRRRSSGWRGSIRSCTRSSGACRSTRWFFVAPVARQFPLPLERLQGAAFVNAFRTEGTRRLEPRRGRGRGPADDGAAHPWPGRGAGAFPAGGRPAGARGLPSRSDA